jgi:hypothetical protein
MINIYVYCSAADVHEFDAFIELTEGVGGRERERDKRGRDSE